MSRWPGKAKAEKTTFGGLSRAELMSRVRSKGNLTTERRLAALLRRTGLRGWRTQQPLPGRPDFAWRRAKVAVFVDGCFWHGHNCGKNISPKTNPREWQKKISGNKARDIHISRRLRRQGWAVVRIWECQLAKEPEKCLSRIGRALEKRHPSRARRKGLAGNQPRARRTHNTRST